MARSLGVTQKVSSNSKHTLLCLYGHNVLGRMYDINAYMFTHFFVWILLDQKSKLLMEGKINIHFFRNADG